MLCCVVLCCSSLVSDDDPNFFDDVSHVWLTLWVRRWLISPILACSTLPHSGHEYVGPAELLVVDKSRFANSALFLSLRDPVCFGCSCSGMNHTAPRVDPGPRLPSC